MYTVIGGVRSQKSKVDLYDALRREHLAKEISDEVCFEIQANRPGSLWHCIPAMN